MRIFFQFAGFVQSWTNTREGLKMYFLLRIYQPQVTPVQFRPINARILKVRELQVTPLPPRMLKGLTDLRAKEGIPCLVDMVTWDGIFSSFRRIHQSNINLSTKGFSNGSKSKQKKKHHARRHFIFSKDSSLCKLCAFDFNSATLA